MNMGVASQADIRPPEHAAPRKELAQRVHSEGIGGKGVNRQVPGAHGREVPSQKVRSPSRALRGPCWTWVLSWRLGSGGGGRRGAAGARI